MILVFNKTDVKDAGFAKDWMTDFEAFQAALQEEETANVFSSDEGSGGGGSGYMSSLLNSMSLMLEEFYSHLSFVPVSARLGTGMPEFFEAVREKAEEFNQDYLPELQRRRKEREEERLKTRDQELQKMMNDISVGPGGKNPEEKVSKRVSNDDDDDDIDVASDDDEDTDMDDENDREGLEARYRAAMQGNDDSILAEASFAKYLHSQKG
jgi:GPN-loop GTPase